MKIISTGFSHVNSYSVLNFKLRIAYGKRVTSDVIASNKQSITEFFQIYLTKISLFCLSPLNGYGEANAKLTTTTIKREKQV